MTPEPSSNRSRERGFSLVEMLVVVAVIAIGAAVSFPQIARYIRNYKVRAGAQQVADQFQTARAKAIMKNVQLGVIWLPQQTQSAWAYEDDLKPGTGGATDWSYIPNENLTNVLADTAQGPGFVPLPDGIEFDNPANCPASPGAANAWGIRFNSLGAVCQVGAANCVAPTGLPAYTGTNRVNFTAGNATVCVWDRRTNLRRRVIVTAGGRVLIQ